MEAIATLIDPYLNSPSVNLWVELEKSCRSMGIQIAPQPHFSWQGALEYDLDEVEIRLKNLAKHQTPFKVRSSGLGIFTGDAPVLYLPLVKDRKLLQLHQQIWEELSSYSREKSKYYSPDQWMPHITLVYQGLTVDSLLCAVKNLTSLPMQFEFDVNNLVLLYTVDDMAGIRFQFSFE